MLPLPSTSDPNSLRLCVLHGHISILDVYIRLLPVPFSNSSGWRDGTEYGRVFGRFAGIGFASYLLVRYWSERTSYRDAIQEEGQCDPLEHRELLDRWECSNMRGCSRESF